MNTQTIFLIVLAIFVAFGLSYIQYIFKAKTKRPYVYVLAFLRFISIFLILILLINPTFKFKSNQIEKVSLPVLIDNSQSIAYLDSTFIKKDWKAIFETSELKEKYAVDVFTFDSGLNTYDSLHFKAKTTNIARAAEDLKAIYGNKFMPIVLLTDGNQTQGSDFAYAFNTNAKVFPVVVGDTSFVYDARIFQANANKYVYLKNQFPIEIFADVVTQTPTNVNLIIKENGTQVYKKQFALSPTKNTISETVYLTANSVGLKKYEVTLLTDQVEKNTTNNSKIIGVEVIDQKTEIAIVSEIVHPDLGVLKRAIEKNKQRKVSILKPNEVNNISLFDLVVLYQPTTTFETLLSNIKKQNKNYLLFSGLSTNYAWLNEQQTDYAFNLSNQKEQYVAEKTNNFSIFEVPNLPYNQLAHLDFPFGKVEAKTQNQVLFYLNTRGVNTQQAMLAFHQNNNQKKAYWFGENLWKWRVETASDNDNFDILIDKIIQYLAIKTPKQNLVVTSESIYNQTDEIVISAQYFNKNLEYDNSAIIEAELSDSNKKWTKKYSFTKLTSEFVLNLSGLEPGNYVLKVTEKNSKTTVTKNFEVLAFNQELQAVNANVKALQVLANTTNAKVYHHAEIDKLIQHLLQQEEYNPTQKEVITKQKLIDWKWLLILLILTLASEWFIRKYNGLK
nr:hypothetical protein [uncultured Flavobacterium sp.]